MESKGYGGNVCSSQFSTDVIAGLPVVGTPIQPKEKQCANHRCKRPFLSRQEGDNFCSEKCDAYWTRHNGYPYVNNNNDPSWDNAVRIIER